MISPWFGEVEGRKLAPMDTIGVIGGMSWESTAVYYRLLNEEVRDRLGGLRSARIVLESVDFADVEALQLAGDWDGAGELLAGVARRLEAAGADLLLIATNTMHVVAGAVAAATSVPLLHIADPTRAALERDGHTRVGLLGTRYTMEQDFFIDRLGPRAGAREEGHDAVGASGLDVVVPDAAGRDLVHEVIFAELCRGIVTPASRDAYLAVIADLAARGATAVILGCTEIDLLIDPADPALPIPAYDTTALHARAAVDLALTPVAAPA